MHHKCNMELSPLWLHLPFRRLKHGNRSQCHSKVRRHMTASPTRTLVNTVNAATPSINWDDRIALQETWFNSEKGWKVEVEWKNGKFGVGLFAAQDIASGTKLREGITGKNLIEFTTVDEIEDFCLSAGGDEYNSRLRYVSDYLWGFATKGTDERGYASSQNDRERFYGMWIPGNGLNHSLQPNTVYRTSERGIDLFALEDILSGEELYDDYRRHGTPPAWLLDFATAKNLTLNFPGCNEFLNLNDI